METEIITKEAEQIIPPDGISWIKTEGYDLVRRTQDLTVRNEADYKTATELGIQNANVIKRIEALRKAIVQPINDQVKRINDIFKGIALRFNANDESIQNKMEQYRATRKSTESIQTVHTAEGRASVVTHMNFEIVDESLIPRQWLMPDTVKIGRAVRGRVVKEIPGVKIFEERTTAFAAQR